MDNYSNGQIYSKESERKNQFSKTTEDIINEASPIIKDLLKYSTEQKIVASSDNILKLSKRILKDELRDIESFVTSTENTIATFDDWLSDYKKQCLGIASRRLLAIIYIDKVISDNAEKMPVTTINDDNIDKVFEIGYDLNRTDDIC